MVTGPAGSRSRSKKKLRSRSNRQFVYASIEFQVTIQRPLSDPVQRAWRMEPIGISGGMTGMAQTDGRMLDSSPCFPLATGLGQCFLKRP